LRHFADYGAAALQFDGCRRDGSAADLHLPRPRLGSHAGRKGAAQIEFPVARLKQAERLQFRAPRIDIGARLRQTFGQQAGHLMERQHRPRLGGHPHHLLRGQ